MENIPTSYTFKEGDSYISWQNDCYFYIKNNRYFKTTYIDGIKQTVRISKEQYINFFKKSIDNHK